MQRYLSRTRSVAAFMAVAAALCWSSTSLAATPTLGPDCGTGAAIVGSDSAGKVTLGQRWRKCCPGRREDDDYHRRDGWNVSVGTRRHRQLFLHVLLTVRTGPAKEQ